MRLFTAIAIAPHVRDNLARVLKELRPLAPLIWSPVENLHITSKFIGEWPEETLSELETALDEMKTPGPFEASIGQFGYLPNPQKPRALFTAVKAGPELAALAKATEDALLPLGIAREDRAYSPHLTLARIKHENVSELREHIAKMTNFDFGTFPVTEFHLYLSQTGPKGSTYTSLGAYPLLGAKE